MLAARRISAAILAGLFVIIAGAAYAGPAAAEVTCHWEYVKGDFRYVCEDDGGGGGGEDPGKPGEGKCYQHGVEIACSNEYGTWDGDCYARLADPQPDLSDPVWGGRTDGVIVQCTVAHIGPGGSRTHTYLKWSPETPGTGPSPRGVADMAVAQMHLAPITIGIVPKPDPGYVGIVGMPVWMWIDSPTENTAGPITRTASSGAITVTATATLSKVVWSMGDGHSVTCAGSLAVGTPYVEAYGKTPSPSCGYMYEQVSASKASGKFTVQATSTWDIAWSGGGQTGTITIDDLSARTYLTIGEIQTVRTH